MHRSISIVFGLVASTFAIPLVPRTENVSVKTLYQGENGTWYENLAFRPNANLLVTTAFKPEVLEFSAPDYSSPTVVATAADADSCSGIVQYASDKFAFLTGNFSLSAGVVPGSGGLWGIDYTGCEADDEPIVTQISPLPDVHVPNGLEALQTFDGVRFLIADSQRGVVSMLDPRTNVTSVVVSDPLLGTPHGSGEGVNGLKLLDNRELYFTNSALGYYGRVELLPNGTAAGPAELLVNQTKTGLPSAGYSDDFAVSGDGTGFVAGGSENAILRLSADGQQQTIAGDLNSTLIAEPTAVALQESDEGFNLFVTTAGGEAAPVDGTEIVGAQLLLVSVPLSEGSAQRM